MTKKTVTVDQDATIAEKSEFVTPQDIAKVLDVTAEAVQNRFKDGTLRGYRLWGKKGPWRMRKEDFQKLLRENGTIIDRPTN
jgi:predicted transcriptional regulator